MCAHSYGKYLKLGLHAIKPISSNLYLRVHRTTARLDLQFFYGAVWAKDRSRVGEQKSDGGSPISTTTEFDVFFLDSVMLPLLRYVVAFMPANINTLAHIAGYVEFGWEAFCRWDFGKRLRDYAYDEARLQIAHQQRATANNSTRTTKNSSTPPIAHPSPTTSCPFKPSQKHQTQETATYAPEDQQPVVHPSLLISSTQRDTLAK